MAIDGAGTVLSTTIAINLGKSEQDIDRLKQKVVELKTAIDSLSKGQSKIVMLDGVNTSITDLNKKLKELQSTIDGLSRTKIKTDVGAGSLAKDAEDATGKLRTYRQELNEIQKLKDQTMHLSGKHAAEALYGDKEREAYRKLQDFQATLTKAKDAEVDASIKADQRWQAYQRREGNAHDKLNNANDRKEDAMFAMYQRNLDKRYKAYLDNLGKEINAERDRDVKQGNAWIAEQKRQADYISSLKGKQNAEADRQRIKDEENSRKKFSAQMQAQMTPDVGSYGKLVAQIKQVNAEALTLATTMNKTKLPSDITAFNTKREELVKLNNELNKVHKTMGDVNGSIGLMGTFAQKMRGHFTWILAGTLLASLIAIPKAIQDIATETEVMGAKIKQNLELADRYHGNVQGLDSDIKHLSEVAGVFAVGYGANVNDVMEMMQVLSRRFKSPEEITYYTNLAMVLHKLDFVAPKKAAEDLEAVILSMGLNYHEAKQFVDEFSVAVHTARITGTDLLSALQRSGAGFRNMNMNTAEAIALISTLSTVTAKAGANVGTALSSLITNVDFKKGAQALHAYGIEVYDTTGKMRKGVEVWREMAEAFKGLQLGDNDQKANELANALSGGKFRINDLKAILDNWGEFEKILNDIETKASPELTTKLLNEGMKTFDTNLKQLSASLQVLGMTLGQETLPALKSMVIGLTEGVQWLNAHRKEVTEAMRCLKLLIEVLVAYKVQQLLANSALGGFTSKLVETALAEGSFTKALGTMSTSMKNFALAARSAMISTMAVLAVFHAVKETIDATGQANGEKAYLEKHPVQGGLQGLKEVDDVRALIAERDRLAELPGVLNTKRIAELNQKIRDALAKDKADNNLADVNKMVAAVEKNMTDHTNSNIFNKVVEGQDLNSSGKGSGGGVVPTDGTGKLQRDAYKDAIALAMHNAKLKTEEYNASLEVLNNTEEICGKTVENTTKKFDLMQKRWQTFNDQEWYSAAMAETLEKDLDEKIGASGDLLEQLGMPSQEAWNKMNKTQKAALKIQKRDILEAHADIQAETKAYYTWMEDAAKNHTDKVKMESEIQKLILTNEDPSKIYSRARSNNANTEAYELAQVDKHRLDAPNTTNKIKTDRHKADLVADKAYQKHLDSQVLEAQEGLNKAKTEAEKKFYEAQLRLALDNANKQRTVVAQTVQAIKELEDEVTLKAREGMASITRDVLLEGKSLKSVWGSLWKGLADDALKQLFRVQNGSSSILGNLLSLFGGTGGRPKINGTTVEGPLRKDGTFASGGLVKQPTNALIGETYEEETVINLDKLRKGDVRQQNLLAYANSKTGGGIEVGTNVVASVSERTMQNAQSASLQSSANARHIAELEHANTLMIKQNQMMLSLVQNQGKNNGNTTIVTTAVSAEQVLGVLQSNPDALANILGRHRSSGFR